MIDKAWRAVTPLTIHSCFKKSGFPSPNLVDMDDTLTEFNAEPSLWEALPEQDLTFDDYVLVDTDIAVWGALSDAEIVALDHNNTESDEDESEELTPVTLLEAKVSLNKLRNFSLQNLCDEDILQASFVLEKSIDKIFQLCQCRLRKSVIVVTSIPQGAASVQATVSDTFLQYQIEEQVGKRISLVQAPFCSEGLRQIFLHFNPAAYIF
ncbi:tigger transposable element-derived protein 6 [Trichonephila clavipes]|uniref:Tigger transposable element-derived protein 6 n=1 Tax=Trichonephila clavipes TaxID=2585209 RepID=A0A8X6S2K0_TRICX|nr:tigger transposable element-derived protein 6 [Trichonephila clavipes]